MQHKHTWLELLYAVIIFALILVVGLLVHIDLKCHKEGYLNRQNPKQNEQNKEIENIEEIEYLVKTSNTNMNEKNYNIPKIIWTFWDDESLMPVSIQNTIKYNRTTIGTWDYRVLNGDTVYNYIPRSDWVPMEELGAAQKADWIRLYLLDVYGGCWCDAGVLINHEMGLDKLREECTENQSEFGGFYFKSRIVDENPFSFIENYFMMAPIHSNLMHRWRSEFEHAIRFGFTKYKKKLQGEGFDLSQIFPTQSPDDTYLTMHACFYRISRSDKMKVLLYKAEDSLFKVQDDCKWDRTCIHSKLDSDPEVKDIPFIKLVTNDRLNFDLSNYGFL